MKKTLIENVLGAFVCEVDRFHDERGYFQPLYKRSTYSDDIINILQTQISCSKKNVVRGLHVAPYGKLCTCVKGKLFDVVADVRPGSPTYKNWFGVWLTENNLKQLFVPAGCAHGFFSAEDDTILMYSQDGLWNPSFEPDIHWRDPSIAVSWPDADEYILSEKDQKAQFLQV